MEFWGAGRIVSRARSQITSHKVTNHNYPQGLTSCVLGASLLVLVAWQATQPKRERAGARGRGV